MGAPFLEGKPVASIEADEAECFDTADDTAACIVGAATEYGRLGFRCVPLKPRSKTPWQARWQQRATGRAETIRRWPSEFRHGNLGLRVPRGMVVLDVDPRNGGVESLRALTNHGSLPPTAQALTGAGGTHLLFRLPRSMRAKTTHGWRPGLDVLGSTAMFVVEPSVHPDTGREYVWLRHPRQGIAQAPLWLLDQLERDAAVGQRNRTRQAKGKAGRVRAIRAIGGADLKRLGFEADARFPITGFGQRWDLARRLTCSLHCRGYAPTVVREVVLAWFDRHRDLTRATRFEMELDVDALIRSTVANDRLDPASPQHAVARAEIRLTRAQRAALDPAPTRTRRASPLSKRRSLTSARLCDGPETPASSTGALCRSHEESVVVEALLVCVLCRIEREDGDLLWTNSQLVETIRDRRGEQWGPTKLRKQLAKYVSRPGKPASICELLHRVETGDRRPGEQVGRPSKYELASGMRWLLGLSSEEGASLEAA